MLRNMKWFGRSAGFGFIRPDDVSAAAGLLARVVGLIAIEVVAATGAGCSTVPAATSDLASDSPMRTLDHNTNGLAAPPNSANAFYVCAPSTCSNASDDNAGTLAAPFATLTECQSEMEASGSVKTCYVRAGNYDLSATLSLTARDSGQIWQYYPPDGVDSAVLNFGGHVDGIRITGVSNLTINGLRITNVQNHAIDTQGPGRLIVIENCDLGFNTEHTAEGGSAPLLLFSNVTNSKILNNYVHDTLAMGIGAYAFDSGDRLDGVVISGNVVLRSIVSNSDSGAIYINMRGSGIAGGRVTISNNFVRDYGASTVSGNGLHCIYLDDNTSNTTVTGNICGPPLPGSINNNNINNMSAFLVNDDRNSSDNANDSITGNLIDIGNSGLDGIGLLTGSNITFKGNIIISDFIGSYGSSYSGRVGFGYAIDSSIGATGVDIADNLYINYAAGGGTFSSVAILNDGSANDRSPQMPTIRQLALTCTKGIYALASNSIAFSAPVNFPGIAGGWGPFGFRIPPSTSGSAGNGYNCSPPS